jgi:hypothetical protein
METKLTIVIAYWEKVGSFNGTLYFEYLKAKAERL